MHDAIKSIIPAEHEFDADKQEWLEKYNNNVTYIFKITRNNQTKVYSLEDWVDSFNIDLLGKHKLRYDDFTMMPAFSTGRLATNEPLGWVFNMSEEDAEKFDKKLLMFLLMQESDNRFTVDRINNVEIYREKEAAQEQFFNSLFSVE